MEIDWWRKIEEAMKKSDMEIEEIDKLLEKGHDTFQNKNLKQEALVHISSKKSSVLQASYFDRKGAVGDFEALTTKEMAKKLHEYGFLPCGKEDFQFTLLAEHLQTKNKEQEEELEL